MRWSVIALGGPKVETDEGQGKKGGHSNARLGGGYLHCPCGRALRKQRVLERIDPTRKTGSCTQKPEAHGFGAHEDPISLFVRGTVRYKTGIHELGFENKLEEGRLVGHRSLTRSDVVVTKLNVSKIIWTSNREVDFWIVQHKPHHVGDFPVNSSSNSAHLRHPFSNGDAYPTSSSTACTHATSSPTPT